MRDTKCFRVQIMKDQDKMQNEKRRLATCQHAGVLTKAKDERDSLRSNSEEDGCRSSFSLTYVFVQEQLDDGDLGGLRDGLPATVWSFRHQAGRTADGVSELRRRFGCPRMMRCSGDGGGACCYVRLATPAAKELGHKRNKSRWKRKSTRIYLYGTRNMYAANRIISPFSGWRQTRSRTQARLLLILQLDGPAGRHDNKDGFGTLYEEIEYCPCALTFAQEGIVTIHENKEKK
jgi:hypothetical protein